MLWLPEKEASRQADSARAEQARVLSQVETLHDLKRWEAELRKLDPYLQLVKARDDAKVSGLKPGYFHILRRPPAGLPTIIVHEGPNGEFRDLDAGIFQTLRDADMWSSERQRDREKRIRQAEKAQERAEEREREERVQEVLDRAKARYSPGTRIPRAI